MYMLENKRDMSNENLQACPPDEVSGYPVISSMVECRSKGKTVAILHAKW